MASSSDEAVLQTIGHDFIQTFVSVTVETFITGISSPKRCSARATLITLPYLAIYSVLVFKASQFLLYAYHYNAPVPDVEFIWIDFYRRKNRTIVSVYTCIAVFTMYIMALALWMIDIHNLITEVQMTLLSTSDDSLSDDYSAALSSILRLSSVEDVVYAYMVRFPPFMQCLLLNHLV